MNANIFQNLQDSWTLQCTFKKLIVAMYVFDTKNEAIAKAIELNYAPTDIKVGA